MAFEQTWRWFGPNDPITLKEIKQTGATGIVSALHQIPVGNVWPVQEIVKRKQIIEKEGFNWSVVESVPVHEDIKKHKGNYNQYIENYKQTIKNLGGCGIDIVCYNFMPILDWLRTDLKVIFNDEAITTKFETNVLAAFDLFMLKRKNAENDYSREQINNAEKLYGRMINEQKEILLNTVLYGLPGSLEAYTLEEFRDALGEYDEIGEIELRKNLHYFIKEIIPVAEEAGVSMGIHPDDPPWSLLGLPRVVGNKADLQQILDVIDSPSNGITFCTGSFGASYKNDILDMAKTFAHRINFIHLRNLTRDSEGNFIESYHLDGDIDLFGVMKELLLEQQKRINQGRKDIRLPMRPDHGHLMMSEQNKHDIYPGYSLMGRMRGLAELRGMELGIRHSLGI
jgi:mannonate dehydratase